MVRAVGIVTLGGDVNYGNRLQNYALQESVRRLGFPVVESIEGLPRDEGTALKARRLLATGYGRRHQLMRRAVGLKGGRALPDLYSSPLSRRQAIHAFTRDYIVMAPNRYSSQWANSEYVRRYERIIVGSDQVWNPAFTQGNPEWFLSFANLEQRVAYAASIGVSHIPSYLRGRYRHGLLGIERLSVREDQAAGIVQDLAGKKPRVVLDPTMLLDRESWERVLIRPSRLESGSYVATFMLGQGDTRKNESPDMSNIKRFARSQALTIWDLHSSNVAGALSFGPSEFIGAISGATILVTDSFHAAVFATIFKIPYLLVSRGEMNSRFATLTDRLGLGDRSLAQWTDIESARDVDWESVGARLETARADSLKFLEDSLRN